MGTLRAAYAYTPAAYINNTPPPPQEGTRHNCPFLKKKNVSVRVHVHKARYEGK